MFFRNRINTFTFNNYNFLIPRKIRFNLQLDNITETVNSQTEK